MIAEVVNGRMISIILHHISFSFLLLHVNLPYIPIFLLVLLSSMFHSFLPSSLQYLLHRPFPFPILSILYIPPHVMCLYKGWSRTSQTGRKARLGRDEESGQVCFTVSFCVFACMCERMRVCVYICWVCVSLLVCVYYLCKCTFSPFYSVFIFNLSFFFSSSCCSLLNLFSSLLQPISLLLTLTSFLHS